MLNVLLGLKLPRYKYLRFKLLLKQNKLCVVLSNKIIDRRYKHMLFELVKEIGLYNIIFLKVLNFSIYKYFKNICYGSLNFIGLKKNQLKTIESLIKLTGETIFLKINKTLYTYSQIKVLQSLNFNFIVNIFYMILKNRIKNVALKKNLAIMDM